MAPYNKRVTDEQVAQIVALYPTMSARDVGEKVGCHRQTVINEARKAGLEIRPRCKRKERA